MRDFVWFMLALSGLQIVCVAAQHAAEVKSKVNDNLGGSYVTLSPQSVIDTQSGEKQVIPAATEFTVLSKSDMGLIVSFPYSTRVVLFPSLAESVKVWDAKDSPSDWENRIEGGAEKAMFRILILTSSAGDVGDRTSVTKLKSIPSIIWSSLRKWPQHQTLARFVVWRLDDPKDRVKAAAFSALHNPENADLQLFHCFMLLRNSQAQQARKVAQQVKQTEDLQPHQNIVCRLLYAISLYECGEYSDALHVFSSCVEPGTAIHLFADRYFAAPVSKWGAFHYDLTRIRADALTGIARCQAAMHAEMSVVSAAYHKAIGADLMCRQAGISDRSELAWYASTSGNDAAEVQRLCHQLISEWNKQLVFYEGAKVVRESMIRSARFAVSGQMKQARARLLAARDDINVSDSDKTLLTKLIMAYESPDFDRESLGEIPWFTDDVSSRWRLLRSSVPDITGYP